MKILCMYCLTPLPGSDPNAERVSHGLCEPLCAKAIADGWGESSVKPQLNPKPGAVSGSSHAAPVSLERDEKSQNRRGK